MTAQLAIGSDDVTKLSVGIIIGLIVVGALLSAVITAIIGRIVVLAVVLVLAFAAWQQRGHIEDAYSKHDCNLTARFFGFRLDAPQSLQQACAKRTPSS